MIDAYLSDMVGFFEEIARPGWSGSSRWQSEFAELTVKAEPAAEDSVGLRFSVWWRNEDRTDNERRGKLLVRGDDVFRFVAQLRELTGFRGKAERLRPV